MTRNWDELLPRIERLLELAEQRLGEALAQPVDREALAQPVDREALAQTVARGGLADRWRGGVVAPIHDLAL